MSCIRNMWYQMMGYEVGVAQASSDYQGIGIQESGTDRHLRLQGWISRMNDRGIACKYWDVGEYLKLKNIDDVEVVSTNGVESKCFNRKLNMRFMTDGIVEYQGQFIILEIKTETTNKNYRRKDVDSYHNLQGYCYSLNFRIPDVVFVYENRDNLELKAYHSPVS